MSEAQSPQTTAKGLPSDPELWLFEGFDGINSKSSRTGIGDKEMYWCKNLMPLGENYLRALPSNTNSYYYTAAGGRTVGPFYFFTLNSIDAFIVFLDDGSADIVKVSDKSVIHHFAAGTFTGIGNVTQWGNQFLMIITNQSPNGFYIWDGTSLYSAGSLGPIVQLDNVGNGYASAPTVTAFGGNGTGATFTATIVGNQVTDIIVNNPGSGYTVNDVVALRFVGGGAGSGATAVLSPTLSGDNVNAVNVVHAGAGYTSSAKVVFKGGGGIGAQATPILTGKVGSITVTNGGALYTSAPTVTITGDGGTGTGAVATAQIDSGQVSEILLSSYGSGYISPVVVTLSGGGSGTGFVNATADANLVSAVVSGITVTNSGNGYVDVPTAYILDPLATVAQAHINPMPFGIKGNDIETYVSRVWIIDKNKCYFTSPGNPSDFDVGNGAGAFKSNDSFLKNQYVALMSAEGFLYFFGDSSINAVSGVTTQGTPPITTFTNQNLDPQVGTVWHNTVKVFARATMLANAYGIHALYGGAVQKVSAPMDNILDASNGLVNPGFALSAAIAQVFGVKVYMLLVPVQDIFTGVVSNCLVMWDGKKWWIADQDNAMTYITEQETQSTINAFGTDGTNIFKLFDFPSSNTKKSVQSKLWTKPNYMMKKRLTRLSGLYQNNFNETLVVQIALDNDVSPGALAYAQTFPFVSSRTQHSAVQNCDQVGIALGFTLYSVNKDFVLVSFAAIGQQYGWLT